MKNLLSLSIILVLSFQLFAQDDNSILLKIDNREVTKGEFERIYKKNSNIESSENKSITEYLELFTNFKLKVIEAENLGLDTNKAFKNELEGYRKQLAKPYLTDKETDEKILKEAYERMLWDVRASHILVKVTDGASPKDTLIAYNKAIKIRNRIIKGEDFNKIAEQISDDPSAKRNKGDLGYFTVFQMVYSFENAAYNLKKDEISMPVRTKFGYHILKLTDKRKAKGEIKVAHIMKATPKGATPAIIAKAKKSIFEINAKIKAGEDFAELAKQNSDDKGSAVNGGNLPMFGTGRMVPEFEQTAFGLKEIGDISEPIKTSFGWHIIKLIDTKPIGDYEDIKADIKAKVIKDSRSAMSRKTLVKELKTEYKYADNQKNLKAINSIVDKSIFEAKWEKPESKKLNNELFSFADKKFTQNDFVNYILKVQRKSQETNISDYITNLFEKYTEREILTYEESILENKYPEFNYLIKEYHDGILLFELTDKLVWSKATTDTIGLEKFHKENASNYMWKTRVNASIYECPNMTVANKAKKIATKRINKKYTAEVLAAKFAKMTNSRDSLKIDFTDKVYNKGDNDKIDAVEWTKGVKNTVIDNGNIYFVSINEVIQPSQKTLKEAKGIITADYQTYLEKEWIASLKAKYKVEVNSEILSTIKQ